ncbi:hypothetical protein CK203_103322 [Vitis vinifera]|uniref:Uncharacterized protein n=1 Tax=Vitis vinifera TaxID=29760 RepID=A0A438FHT8_VITVI|nr:hypothetical protein CK203_103322 [Vitis vinifera]
MENRRKIIVRSFSIAKDIYTTGRGMNHLKSLNLKLEQNFLSEEWIFLFQRLKMNEERDRAAKTLMRKMSVEQLSELMSFYHMMGQICSEVLDKKLHGIVNDVGSC